MFLSKNTKQIPNDRFIPLRLDSIYNSVSRPSSFCEDQEATNFNGEFINYAKRRYSQENYKNALRQIMFPYESKILNFFPPKRISNVSSIAFKNRNTWPVLARKKPVIEAPETMLDMPHFDSSIEHNVVDWSSKNCLITIFENEVHLWHPKEEYLRDKTNTAGNVQTCVKWNLKGDRFAVGLKYFCFGLWDLEQKKLTNKWNSCCGFCTVTSFEWLNDETFCAGCDRGVLSVCSFCDKTSFRICFKYHSDSIINIKRSCDGRFIATSSLDKNVIVWKCLKNCSSMEPCFQIHSRVISKAIAWHPWKSTFLAIGLGYNEGRVVLYNVSTHKLIDSEDKVYLDASVDALTFNPITGELVATYFVQSSGNSVKGCGIVAVMSNFNNITEELHIHSGSIPYLLWSNDGKSLATVSSDENLCIWNFFGPKNLHKNSNKKSKEASKILNITIR